MCGLVGIIPAKSSTPAVTRDLDKYMETLLYLDTYRGPHATGIAVIKSHGNSYRGSYLKATVPGSTFVDWGPYKKLAYSFNSASMLMGHNRYATMGGKGKEAAHPHFTDNVILCHNGTLTRYSDLATIPGGINDLDSARITYEIDLNGSTAQLFDKLHGAYALTWFDRRDGKVRIARNAERTLWWCVVDKSVFMYASNKWMLDAVQTIHKLTFSVNPTPFQQENMWEIDINKFDIVYEKKDNKVFFSFEGLDEVPFKNAPQFYGQGATYSGTYANKINNNQKQIFNLPQSSHVTPSEIFNEVQRSNKILTSVGLSVGQPVEVVLDEIFYLTGAKKGKRKGCGFGAMAARPNLNVVFIDLMEKDVIEEADTYNAIIKAAVKNGKSKDIVLYVTIKSVNKIIMSAKEYANIYAGDEEKAVLVESILGDQIPVPFDDIDMIPVGPSGLKLTPAAVKAILKSGCSVCKSEIDSAENVTWTDATMPVCKTCVDKQNNNGFSSAVCSDLEAWENVG